MFDKLFSPFLLRRLIRSQESSAQSLATIARILTNHFGDHSATVEFLPAGDDDLSYASDGRTYSAEQDDARRLSRPIADDES